MLRSAATPSDAPTARARPPISMSAMTVKCSRKSGHCRSVLSLRRGKGPTLVLQEELPPPPPGPSARETPQERAERQRREDIRRERARERERERRLEAKDAHGYKKSKLTRDRDRDVSEKMALGQVYFLSFCKPFGKSALRAGAQQEQCRSSWLAFRRRTLARPQRRCTTSVSSTRRAEWRVALLPRTPTIFTTRRSGQTVEAISTSHVLVVWTMRARRTSACGPSSRTRYDGDIHADGNSSDASAVTP